MFPSKKIRKTPLQKINKPKQWNKTKLEGWSYWLGKLLKRKKLYNGKTWKERDKCTKKRETWRKRKGKTEGRKSFTIEKREKRKRNCHGKAKLKQVSQQLTIVIIWSVISLEMIIWRYNRPHQTRDSASNLLTVPLVGQVFGWHD